MLLLSLGVVLILIPITRDACHRMGIPACVGYIAIGLALSALRASGTEFSPDTQEAFALLAQLGVVALLFRVGLKSHTRALIAKLPQASLIWLGDVAANLAIVYVAARYGLHLSIGTSLVVATALSATSVAVSAVVWDEMGRLGSDRGQLLIDVAELDDLSGVLLLSLLLAVIPVVANGGALPWAELGTAASALLIKLALFIAGCYLFAHNLEPSFTRLNRRLFESGTGFTISILGAGLAIASIADRLGFSLAIGALFAGLAFSRDPEAVGADGRFRYFHDFLTPFFFIHIGMQVEFGVVADSAVLGLVLLIAGASGKLIGVGMPALASMRSTDAITLGISMVPRAEIALVIVHQCRSLDARLVSAEVFGAVVVVSLATCILSPTILRRRLAHEPKP